MEIVLITIGKNKKLYLDKGLKEYIKRIQNYVSFKIDYIPDIKKNNKTCIRKRKTTSIFWKRSNNWC